MKEKALARMQDPDTASRRFRAPDALLVFLKSLDDEKCTSARDHLPTR
jgi:hypothetical protein